MGYEIYLIVAFVVFVYLLVQILHMQKPAHKDHPVTSAGNTETISVPEEKVNKKRECIIEDTIQQ